MPEQISELMAWFTQDPVGRKVALGGVVVLALVVLFVVLKTMRWAAARWKMLFGVAVLVGGVYYASMVVFDQGPVAWAVAGMGAIAVFMGVAMYMTQAT